VVSVSNHIDRCTHRTLIGLHDVTHYLKQTSQNASRSYSALFHDQASDNLSDRTVTLEL